MKNKRKVTNSVLALIICHVLLVSCNWNEQHSLKEVENIFNKVKKFKQKGKNADYIPDLQKGNPSIYAISVCNINGDVMNFGDYKTEVGIESVSKVFTLSLALDVHGIDKLMQYIGNTKGWTVVRRGWKNNVLKRPDCEPVFICSRNKLVIMTIKLMMLIPRLTYWILRWND